MQTVEQDFVAITEICDGNLGAMWSEALQEVAEDYADPRKPQKAKRVVSFTVEFDFDDHGRAAVASSYNVKKPAAEKIVADGRLYVSVQPGRPIVVSAFKPAKQEMLPGIAVEEERRVN